MLGSQGSLLPERLLVRAEATENVFHPLDHPIPILIADMRPPVRETSFDIQLRPTWLDKPGRYRGNLVAKPFLPSGKTIPLVSDPRNDYLGEPQSISIEFEISEVMIVSVSETEIRFNADAGPGMYQGDQEISFTIVTNASTWRVNGSASPLTSDKGKIPPERLIWERLDAFGNVEAKGTLGHDATVAQGLGPVEELEVRLRFNVEVLLKDPPGQYQGSISLTGMTGS